VLRRGRVFVIRYDGVVGVWDFRVFTR
jgi:hypothetical protein